jgi:hypothetical protein
VCPSIRATPPDRKFSLTSRAAETRASFRLTLRHCISFNETGYRLRLILDEIVHGVTDQHGLHMDASVPTRRSAIVGTSFANGDPSPTAKYRGTSLRERCAALNSHRPETPGTFQTQREAGPA